MARKPKPLAPELPASTEPATPATVAAEVKARTTPPLTATIGQVPIDPAATWTADGVGEIPVALHNFLFARYDMADMTKEEEKGLAEDAAYYLNKRWPNGAKYEPEARILMRLSGLWIPRLVAVQKRKEMETEAARLAAQTPAKDTTA